MFYSVIADLPFGIDITKILLHLFNFVILGIGLTFLLYKPILKFIKKRQEDIQAEIDKGEQMQAEAKQKQEEYDELLSNAKDQAEKLEKEALDRADSEAKGIIEAANEQAKAIEADAKDQARELKKDALLDAKDQIAEAVITLAQEIVDRELSKEDNERIINKRLEEWKGDVK